MQGAGLILEQDQLKFCYDSTGASYKTPIACINEPTSYGVDKEEERLEGKESPEEPKTLRLKIRNAQKFEDKEIEISEKETVRILKEKYGEIYNMTEIGEEGEKVRILAGGLELKTEKFLYQYNINDELRLIGVLK